MKKIKVILKDLYVILNGSDGSSGAKEPCGKVLSAINVSKKIVLPPVFELSSDNASKEDLKKPKNNC